MCARQVIYSNMARKPPMRPKVVGTVNWPAAPFLDEEEEEEEPEPLLVLVPPVLVTTVAALQV